MSRLASNPTNQSAGTSASHATAPGPAGEATGRNGERRLIVLGATGSIGCNTLDVVEHLNAGGDHRFRVVGLAAGRSVDKVIEQVQRFDVPAVALADEAAAAAVRDALPGVTVFGGAGASRELVEEGDATDVIAAVVGAAGLPATVAAIDRGCRIGLANKETLVAAGALVAPRVAQRGATLIPVDSEHSAIYQCLDRCDTRDIKKIVLTASGGPFRTASKDAIHEATVEEALNHPTWSMGPKITIDSASMMNKALEIIEAHWLFDLPAEQIDVIIHPQSIAHSFVEFNDHSVLAQLGAPDMRTPIQYALTYPARPPGVSEPLDWAAMGQLTFEPPDPERFPSLSMAFEVVRTGGLAGAVFNAANEAAVEAFLAGRIRFGQIFELVEHALSTVDTGPGRELDDVLEADRRTREVVDARLAR